MRLVARELGQASGPYSLLAPPCSLPPECAISPENVAFSANDSDLALSCCRYVIDSMQLTISTGWQVSCLLFTG